MSVHRKSISEGTKRAVRKACGYGCAICGLGALWDYHHIDDHARTQDDSAENLVLLCVRCHREVTAGLIQREKVLDAKTSPAALGLGATSPFTLRPSAQLRLKVGTSSLVADGEAVQLHFIYVGSKSLCGVRIENGHALLTLRVLGLNGRTVFEIADNELVVSTDVSDYRFEARRFEVRVGTGKQFTFAFEMSEDGVLTVVRGEWRVNGNRIRVHGGRILSDGVMFDGSTARSNGSIAFYTDGSNHMNGMFGIR